IALYARATNKDGGGTRIDFTPERDRQVAAVTGQNQLIRVKVSGGAAVEIKSPRLGRAGDLVAAVAGVIKQSGRAERVLVSSFDPVALVQLYRHLPDVAVAHLFHDQQSLALRRGWAGHLVGASLVHPQHTLVDAASLARWHRVGFAVNVWTVNDDAELRRLAALGVDGVFADDPGHALAVLAGE
ncbi:MAG TPA: glycerophosphodiester phosphodiesterase, partial [Kofleriaceae bacterium]|nr:glycerophosphodiester phosphodiesterase [Kofleriaceae bacterium]